jgi:hypothetical protein
MFHDKSSYITNCKESLHPEKDWGISNAAAAGYPLLELSEIPPAWDLRKDTETWWDIQDQDESGACVGFAVADSVLRWHFVKSNHIQPTEHLSVRYLWMAAKEMDEFSDRPTTFMERRGTSIKAALTVASKYGVVLEKDLPFESGRLYPGDENDFYAKAAKMRITSYFNLGKDLGHWRRWIFNHGPVAIRIDPDQSWINLVPFVDTPAETETQSGKLDTYSGSVGLDGHACALVGYTPDGFFVRNSWGSNWGAQGYAFASNAYAGMAFTEAYGVVV